MYICICKQVTDKKIVEVVKNQGVKTLRDLSSVCALGTQCGKCCQAAKHILDSTQANCPEIGQ